MMLHAELHVSDKPAPRGRSDFAGGEAQISALLLASLLASLGTSSINVALPSLAQDFNAPLQEAQWVLLSYLLAVTALVISAGRLGDSIGPRRLLLTGLALFSVASLACALAPSLAVLCFARALQGLAGAILLALPLAMAGGLSTRIGIGSTLGLIGSMSALGTAMGPSLGGLLLSLSGWRAIFLVNVPLGLAALALALLYLKPDGGAKAPLRRHWDISGSLLLVLSLLCYTLGLSLGKGHFGKANCLLLLGSLLGSVLFVQVERRSSQPLVDLDSLGDSSLRSSLLLSLVVSAVLMASLVLGPFYLSLALQLSPAQSGLLLSAGPLLVALSGWPAGRLADRFGAKCISLLGLITVTGAAGLLALLPLSAGVPGYLLGILSLTAGYALFQTANNTSVMQGAEGETRGLRSGLLNLSRNLGLVSGSSLMTAVFTMALGGGDISSAAPQEVSAGLRVSFAFAGLLLLAALLFSRGRAQTAGAILLPCAERNRA